MDVDSPASKMAQVGVSGASKAAAYRKANALKKSSIAFT